MRQRATLAVLLVGMVLCTCACSTQPVVLPASGPALKDAMIHLLAVASSAAGLKNCPVSELQLVSRRQSAVLAGEASCERSGTGISLRALRQPPLPKGTLCSTLSKEVIEVVGQDWLLIPISRFQRFKQAAIADATGGMTGQEFCSRHGG